MAFRRRMIWTSVAIGVVLTISALSTASAQAPGGRQAGPPYRPAAGAKDLRAVLFTRSLLVATKFPKCQIFTRPENSKMVSIRTIRSNDAKLRAILAAGGTV